jgi:ABC-type transport system involved in multi-copper enzyme maturation permease subunit
MTIERRHARLGRYFWWQFHDYMLHQAPATAAIVTMYAYLTLMPILNGSRTNGRRFDLATLPLPVVRDFFADLLASLMLLGTLFATNGIVATDRKTGYYRFYFAKPVSASRFYTNAFVANGAGLLTVSLALLLAFAFLVRPILSLSFIPVVAAIYVSFAGIGFLLSTIWRFDWLSLVSVAIASSLGWGMWGEDPGIRGWLVRLLPPMHRAADVYAYVAGTSPTFAWTTQIWLTGYGAACFLIGLWILRTRSLATQ